MGVFIQWHKTMNIGRGTCKEMHGKLCADFLKQIVSEAIMMIQTWPNLDEKLTLFNLIP
jgi:hypothetical protein